MGYARSSWVLALALLSGCVHENQNPLGRLIAEYTPGQKAETANAPYDATYVLREWPAPPADPPPKRWVPEENVVDVFIRGLDRRDLVGFEKSDDGKLMAIAGKEKIPLDPGKYTWHIEPSSEYTGMKWFVHEVGECTVDIVSLPFDLAAAAVAVPIAVGACVLALPVLIFAH